MALGVIDFSGVKDFEAIAGTFDGQTAGWEAKPTKAGDSMNVEAKFEYVDSDGNLRKFTNRWNLKPTALWRIKRDLISMGADPADFESTNVDLEAVLNRLFGPVPVPVTLTFTKRKYHVDPNDPASEERESQDLVKVVGREADPVETPF